MRVLTNQQLREFLRWSHDKGVTIRDYYDALSKQGIISRAYYHGSGKRLMICPFHEDNAPSLGTLTDKDGTEIFHCFGCGKAGTLIDFDSNVYKPFATTSTRLYRVLTTLGINPDEMLSSWAKDVADQTPQPIVKHEEAPLGYSDVIKDLRTQHKTIIDETPNLLKAFIASTYVVSDNS